MNRIVILCDEDTNALTPPEKLDALYRPALDYGLRINLAVIPWVRTDLPGRHGASQEFLFGDNTSMAKAVPVGQNEALTGYLRENSGYHVTQHGCHHEGAEFACHSRAEIGRRLSQGAAMLMNAGLGYPIAFVPPDDILSATAFDEVINRYRVLVCRRLPWHRIPIKYWPANLLRHLRRPSRWRAGPACILGRTSDVLARKMRDESLVDAVRQTVGNRPLTVLVTQWWRYYPEGRKDRKAIDSLHEVARWLALEPDIRVVTFVDIARWAGFGALQGQMIPDGVTGGSAQSMDVVCGTR